MLIQPFDIENLPAISRSQLARSNALAALAREFGVPDELSAALLDIEGHVAAGNALADVSPLVILDSNRVHDAAADNLGHEPRVRIELNLGHEGVALLETTVPAARKVIASALGVPGSPSQNTELLSSLEKGAAAFVLDWIVDRLARRVGSRPFPWAVSIKCETSAATFDARQDSHVTVGMCRVLGETIPFRFVLPPASPCLERPTSERLDSARSKFRIATHLGRTRATLVARIGEISLPAGDLAHTEVDDVLLLSYTLARLTPGGETESRRDGPLVSCILCNELVGDVEIMYAGQCGASVRCYASLMGDGDSFRVRVERVARWPGAADAGRVLSPANSTDRAASSESTSTRGEGVNEDSSNERSGSESGALADRDAPEVERVLIDDLPLVVSVEIGQTSLTLKELASIGPGSIIDLGQNASTEVTLKVDGRVIGQGNLVRIHDEQGFDEIGVKISRIAFT